LQGGVEYRGLLKEISPFSLFKKYWLTMIRSPIIGTIIGALPGAGATIAAFLAYGEAARQNCFYEMVKHRSRISLTKK